MNKLRSFTAIIVATSITTGCATKLQTFDKNDNEINGIRIPIAQLVKVTTETSFVAIKGAPDPALCNQKKVVESYDYVSSSDFYYVKFEPSQFAKGDFTVTFNDKGVATKISVNSEANTGVDAIGGALGTLLPYYKMTKAEEAATNVRVMAARKANGADIPAEERKAKSCIAEKTSIELEPISVGP